MVWLYENEGGCLDSTTEKGKCGQGINTQSPSPQANVVQKVPHVPEENHKPETESQIHLCTWKMFHLTHHILTQVMIGSHSTHDAKRNYSNHKISMFCTVPTTLERTKFLLTLKAVS